MLDLSQIVPLAIGTVLAVFYIMLLMGSRKYDVLLQSLDRKEYLFPDLYPVGFLVLDKTGYKFKLPVDQERRAQCEIIYGSKYAEYYLRLNYAQKVSSMLFLLPVMFLLMPLLGVGMGLVVGVALIICAYVYFDMQLTEEMGKREDEVANQLPDVLSKLTLLVNAGMILTEAWNRVGQTGKGVVYQEMRLATEDMANGMSEEQAILNFGERCRGNDVKKFCSTLVQNLSKGNKELTDYLKKQTAVSWEEKKHHARRQGEAAGTKLMIPIVLMLVGILVMIVVPLFGNISF